MIERISRIPDVHNTLVATLDQKPEAPAARVARGVGMANVGRPEAPLTINELGLYLNQKAKLPTKKQMLPEIIKIQKEGRTLARTITRAFPLKDGSGQTAQILRKEKTKEKVNKYILEIQKQKHEVKARALALRGFTTALQTGFSGQPTVSDGAIALAITAARLAVRQEFAAEIIEVIGEEQLHPKPHDSYII